MSPEAPQPGLLGPGAAGNRKCQQHCQITPARQNPQNPGAVPWRDRIKVHPAADAFPRPSATERDALADDINTNGLQTGVVLWTPERPHPRRAPKEIYLLDGISRLDAVELAFSDDPEGSEAAI